MRSDKKIVKQTNQLALGLLRVQGWNMSEGYLCYESTNPRARLAWEMACVAQEILTKTEVVNAMANLGLLEA